MQEKYCPSKKPYYEGDLQCHYHGPDTICPLCGTTLRPCNEGTYEPLQGYTLRELGRPHNWRGHL